MTTKHLLSHRLFCAYLALLCWAPLPLASNRPWSWNLLCVLCLLLAAMAVLQLHGTREDPGKPLRFWWRSIALLGLIPLWVTLQTLQVPVTLLSTVSSGHAALLQPLPLSTSSISLDAARTHQFSLLSWSYWLLFILTLLLIDSVERMRTVMIVLVLSGVAQALYGSFMTLSGLEYGFFVKKTAYLGTATGTFVNRNHLAGYLELCLAVGTGLLVASLSKQYYSNWRERLRAVLDAMLGGKIRLRVYLALMVVALLLTRSRMGNVAFFISLPLCGFLLMLLQKKFHKGAVVLFLSMMLIDFLIVGQWFGFSALAERLQSSSVQTENRDEVLRDSLPLAQDYLVTGTGLGTFYTAFPQYRSVEVDAFYDHAHNDYLELTSDLGLPGMFVLALSVLYALFAAGTCLRLRRDQLALGVAFAAVMGIGSLLLHSTVDFNLQIPANAMLFVVLLAFAHLSGHLPREQVHA